MTDKKESTPSDQAITQSAASTEKAATTDINKASTSTQADASPAPKKRTSTQKERTSSTVKNSSSTSGKIALILSIIALFGIGGHYYWQVQQHNKLVDQLLQQNKNQQTAAQSQLLAQMNQQQLKATNQLDSTIENIVAINNASQQRIDEKLAALEQNKPSDWLLHEAEYLIRIAARSLWLDKNTPSAIALLKDADSRLQELNDPALLPVRELLNQDIETLAIQPTLATEEVILKLMGMSKQIAGLPIAMAHLPDSAEPEQNFELSDNTDDWQENLNKSWQQFLTHFITVKRRTANVEALLTPKQQQNLRQNLQLKLQLAQWAASQQQTTLFQQTLADTQTWLTEYFDTDAHAVKHFIEQLAALNNAVISLSLPNQLTSLSVIRDFLNTDKNTKRPMAQSKSATLIESSLNNDTNEQNQEKTVIKTDTAPAELNTDTSVQDEDDNNGAIL